MDLTLPIGSYGERITTRRLEIVEWRRNQYSGRLEYRLKDVASGQRIDTLRWFEEECLTLHEPSVHAAVCKRVGKEGKSCSKPPTMPSGLCTLHKAKLDWDREKQRQKLKHELQKRINRLDTCSEAAAPSAASAPPSSPRRESDTTTLVDETDEKIATSMWGDAALFEAAVYNASTEATSIPLPTKQSWRGCVILIVLCATTVLTSLSLALWWSMMHRDVSGGFTMGGYIVAVGGVILYPIQARHSKTCQCWRPSISRARTM